MIIRPAKLTDSAQICDIWNPIIRDTTITFTTLEKTVADIEQMLETSNPFFIAENDEQVLGFTTYSPFRAGPGYARSMELSINLAETARGKGIGTKLLRTLEAAATDRGVSNLIASVSGSNPAALQFHEANNYTRVGMIPQVGQKFSQRLDLFLLQKLL